MLIYVKNGETLSQFCEKLSGMTVLAADAEPRIVENLDVQRVLHAMAARGGPLGSDVRL